MEIQGITNIVVSYNQRKKDVTSNRCAISVYIYIYMGEYKETEKCVNTCLLYFLYSRISYRMIIV